MTETELKHLQGACDALIERHQSLLLASQAESGEAEISYAPYLRSAGNFYILVSELAKHTQNLLARPQASILFIEAETEAVNPFARQRLTLSCRVQEIDKTHDGYLTQIEAMAEKFGNIISVLRSLPDFHLMQLIPQHGQFVAGFGKALKVDGSGRLQASDVAD